MKKIIIYIFIFNCFYNFMKAQNVGINNSGAAPVASAMLDVSSTTSGALIPRMTSAQRVAIASPANGLLVFDTDLNCTLMYLVSSGAWRSLCDSYGPFYGETTTVFNQPTTLLKTVNIVTTSTTDKILIEGEFDYSKGGTATYVALGLYRNGIEIHEVAKYSVANADNSVKLTWVDVPGTVATQTYTIRWYMGGGAMAGIYGSNLIVTVIP